MTENEERIAAIEAVLARVDEVMKEIGVLAIKLQVHRRGLFQTMSKFRAIRE